MRTGFRRRRLLDGVLDQIATLAKRSIPGAAEVSVTLIRDKKGHTAAFTGELSRNLDEGQYERARGPCLAAADSGERLSSPDMSTETRRPDLAQRALESGCHSSLSIGLPVHTDATIEQAKGIIMGDRHCSPEEAFRILTRLSQDTNRKLRDVALALVNRAAPRKP